MLISTFSFLTGSLHLSLLNCSCATTHNHLWVGLHQSLCCTIKWILLLESKSWFKDKIVFTCPEIVSIGLVSEAIWPPWSLWKVISSSNLMSLRLENSFVILNLKLSYLFSCGLGGVSRPVHGIGLNRLKQNACNKTEIVGNEIILFIRRDYSRNVYSFQQFVLVFTQIQNHFRNFFTTFFICCLQLSPSLTFSSKQSTSGG